MAERTPQQHTHGSCAEHRHGSSIKLDHVRRLLSISKQYKPNKTKPNSSMINPRKRKNNPTHSLTPSRIKYVNTRMTDVYRDAHARTQSSGGRPHSYSTSKPSQTAEGVDGCSVMHDGPRELSSHRGIGISSNRVDSRVSRVAKGWWAGRCS